MPVCRIGSRAPQEFCIQGVIEGAGDWDEFHALTSVAHRSAAMVRIEDGRQLFQASSLRSDEHNADACNYYDAELPGECGPVSAAAKLVSCQCPLAKRQCCRGEVEPLPVLGALGR